jgi:hypothetical protein
MGANWTPRTIQKAKLLATVTFVSVIQFRHAGLDPASMKY